MGDFVAYNRPMNARDYKTFRAGYHYHVYNRGDNKEPIFLDDSDYVNFLQRLKVSMGIPTPSKLRIQPFPAGSFTILAYCLMPNHFHILIKQELEHSIAKLLQRVLTSYVKYFNAKYERVGNLFQDTFKAKVVDNDTYLTYLSAYIHNNPDKPSSYAYSSFPEYVGSRNGNLCRPDFILKYFNGESGQYRKFVEGYSLKEHSKIRHLVFDED